MKTNFIRMLMLVLCCGMVFSVSYGQTPALPLPVSTDAGLTPSMEGGTPSHLGNGNSTSGKLYHVNLFDGSADVNIPIYQYSSPAGNLGVSLSYNTKGVSVSEIASPIGLHWQLNAGGSIVRTMKGIPDETCDTTIADVLLIDTTRLLPYSDDTMALGMMYLLDGFYFPYLGGNGGDGITDHESDDYYVSVGRLSFRFNIGKNGFVFTRPHKNVRVQYTINGNPVDKFTDFVHVPYDSIGFKITDSKGNQYWFKGSDVMKQKFYIPMDILAPTELYDITYYTKWVISKIVLADGRIIHYDYHNKPISIGSPFYREFMRFEAPGISCVYASVKVDITNPLSGALRLSSISYPNGSKVDFIYAYLINRCDNLSADILSEIKVSAGANCLRYDMQQSYATSPGLLGGPVRSIDSSCVSRDTNNLNLENSDTYYRLILNGIRIQSCDSSVSEPYYRFEYSPVRLPRRLSGSQDFFGYYNGATTDYEGTSTIPFHQPLCYNSTPYGVDKTPNIDSMKAGILTGIYNAYGKKIAFEYEAHNLLNLSPDPETPIDNLFMGEQANDGLCLKSITVSDKLFPGVYKKTSYSYSYGVRFLTGGYFHFPYETDSSYNVREFVFNGIYVSPHQFINGSNHGYSQVTVENKNQDGDLLSKREYDFSNFQGTSSCLIVGGSKKYFQLPFTHKQYIKEWEIGLPLSITDYDQNNHIVSKTINHFSFETDTTSNIGKFNNKHYLMVRYGSWDTLFRYLMRPIDSDTYRPYRGKALLDWTATKKYIADNRYIADTVLYQYDSLNNLVSTITQTSKGERIDTRLIYNYRVDGPGTDFALPGTMLYSMTDSGLEKVVATERWKLNDSGLPFSYDNDKLLTAFITVYQFQNGKLWPLKMFNTDIGAPVSYEQYTGIGQGSTAMSPYRKILRAYNTNSVDTGFRETSRVTLFDDKGNPLETQLSGQDLYKAMIWDTATGRQLAAASNCRYSDIAYSGFEESLAESNLTVSGPAANIASDALTGEYVQALWTSAIPGTATVISGTQNLQTGKEYRLSFWAKGQAPSISIGFPIGSNAISLSAPVATKGDWKKYIVRFDGMVGKIHITGTGPVSFIDEIRLYPVGAQMLSRTYEPLFGISSQTDASGHITYYQYDKFGRQTLIRDQDGNILSQTEYHIGQ